MNKSAKTAIHRKHMSAPVKELLQERMLDALNGITFSARNKLRFLDYGCGRGVDVDRLGDCGYKVEGYDPNFQPKKPKGKFHVVLMIYVLNVIEDTGYVGEQDRVDAVVDAWNYVRRGGQLIMVTRAYLDILREAMRNGWKKRGTGYITGSGTFQRSYTPKQLDELACNLFANARTIQYGTMRCGASFAIVTKG